MAAGSCLTEAPGCLVHCTLLHLMTALVENNVASALCVYKVAHVQPAARLIPVLPG